MSSAKQLISLLILIVVLSAVSFFYSKYDRLGMRMPVQSDLMQPKDNYQQNNSNLGAVINESLAEEQSTSGGVFLLPVSEDGLYVDRVASKAHDSPRALALFDVDRGIYIYSDSIDTRLPIASITKLMTAIVILENTASSDIIQIKPEYLNVDGDGADLFDGEFLKRDDLLHIMLIGSINDAAIAFQGYLKSKNIDMVSKMNEKAVLFGMNNTKFLDPAGLDDDGYSSVRDIVKLARSVDNYKVIWDILKKPKYIAYSSDNKIKHSVLNTNKLLGIIPNIIGGKTGYTEKSKGSLVLLVDVNGKKYISVVIGSDDRFSATKKLFDDLSQLNNQ